VCGNITAGISVQFRCCILISLHFSLGCCEFAVLYNTFDGTSPSMSVPCCLLKYLRHGGKLLFVQKSKADVDKWRCQAIHLETLIETERKEAECELEDAAKKLQQKTEVYYAIISLYYFTVNIGSQSICLQNLPCCFKVDVTLSNDCNDK